MTDRSAASGPPMVAYRFEDSRSGDCAVRVIWATIAASCNATVIPDIANSRASRTPTVCAWPDVGLICAAGSSTCTPTASRAWRARRSSR